MIYKDRRIQMPRKANPNTPPEDDRQVLNTTVTNAVAAQVKILALVAQKSPADWLRDLVTRETEANSVQITVNGKTLSA
jgi:hypothetical protein